MYYSQTPADTVGYSFAEKLARILQVVHLHVDQGHSISTCKRLSLKIARYQLYIG